MLIAPAEPDQINLSRRLKLADSHPTTKLCCKCNQVLPLTSFYASRTSKDGRQGPCRDCIRQHYQENGEKLREQSRAWYHNNKDRARSCNQQWKERNRDYLRKYERERHKAKPELKHARDKRYAEKNADKIKLKQKLRHRARPLRNRLAKINHSAKRWKASGTCSRKQWLDKVEYHAWRCFYCKVPLTWETMHIDHRKPLARGGTGWPANLVPACRQCNLRKSWRTDAEFRKLLSNDLSTHDSKHSIPRTPS
jgi:5-methylcytosine-specific restriction endonuclease McrA